MLDPIEKPAWPTRKRLRLLIGAVLIVVIISLSLLVRSARVTGKPPVETGKAAARVLPDDVEGVLTSFSYSEAGEDVRIKISGKRVVRRGRRLLGLRSNLVKTNFIEDLTGSYRRGKGTASFAATRAEWDAEASRPLLLNKDVSVTVNGTQLPGVKHAKIYLKSGVIEVNDDGKSYLVK